MTAKSNSKFKSINCECTKRTLFIIVIIIIKFNYSPEIHSLRRRNLNTGSNKENAIRWKRDDVVERSIPNIYDLQHVAGSASKQGRLLDDKELLLLCRPQQPPRRRQGIVSGDGTSAQGGHCVNGFNNSGALRGIALRPKAAVLVGYEGKEVVLGGLGLGRDGGAGEPPVRVARSREFSGEGVGNKEGGHGYGGMLGLSSMGSVEGVSLKELEGRYCGSHVDINYEIFHF